MVDAFFGVSIIMLTVGEGGDDDEQTCYCIK